MNLDSMRNSIGQTIKRQGARLICGTPIAIIIGLVSAALLLQALLAFQVMTNAVIMLQRAVFSGLEHHFVFHLSRCLGLWDACAECGQDLTESTAAERAVRDCRSRSPTLLVHR